MIGLPERNFKLMKSLVGLFCFPLWIVIVFRLLSKCRNQLLDSIISIDSNQDENCHVRRATSNLFHGYSVQMKDVMNKKRYFSYRIGQQYFNSFFAFGPNERETNGTFFLIVVHIWPKSLHKILHYKIKR